MNKSISWIALIIISLSTTSSKAQDRFYDRDSIQKIEIFFNQPNWDYMMDTSKMGAEGYIPASYVLVNGTRFDSVGVKYKGNSTYDSASLKNPWHIKLSKYKSQSYGTVTDIKLANGYKDPSVIREVLGYQILANYMDCPRSNFAMLYINGNYIGIYSNDEDVDKPFLKDHFYSSGNSFFKCSYSNPSPSVRPNLSYLGTSASSYYMYEMDSKSGWNDLIALCDTLKNNPASIASVLDMDRVIWMLAFNNVMVNLDSYSGLFVQNYYLYKDGTGRFNPIVWDLNMCFGGFPYAGNQSGGLGMLSVQNMQQFPIDFHKNDSDWPLIKLIFSNPTYTRKYYAHIKTIINEQLAQGQWKTSADQYKYLIDAAVKADSNFMYTYTEFQNALNSDISGGSYMIPGIANLLDARYTYLSSLSPVKAAAPVISNSNGYLWGNGIFKFKCNAIDADSVVLGFRTDSTKSFSYVGMYDDGNHEDGLAGDGLYGCIVGRNAVSLDFYIYAENKDAGIFLPARAEHEFLNTSSFNGINEPISQQEKSLTVYPNPCREILYGNLGSGTAGIIQLTDIAGKILYRGLVNNQFSLPMENYPNGMYILNDGTRSIKLVKAD